MIFGLWFLVWIGVSGSCLVGKMLRLWGKVGREGFHEMNWTRGAGWRLDVSSLLRSRACSDKRGVLVWSNVSSNGHINLEQVLLSTCKTWD